MKIDVNNGDVYGNLKIVKELKPLKTPSGQTNRYFLCACSCGNEKKVRLGHIRSGQITSCGCVYGFSKTEEERYIRKIWRAIKYRTAPNYSESHLYYDKGVRVCGDWLNNYNNFKNWALENGLKKGLHIDRINGDKGYSPINCRVVTPTENANNRYNTAKVFYKGKEYPFMDLCRIKKIKCDTTIRNRIKRGWTVEDAFDKKVRKIKNYESNGN